MFDRQETDPMEPPAPAEVVRALRATVLDISPAGDPRDRYHDQG